MTPGAGVHGRPVDVECARWLAEESPLVGGGVETVGIDAGATGAPLVIAPLKREAATRTRLHGSPQALVTPREQHSASGV